MQKSIQEAWLFLSSVFTRWRAILTGGAAMAALGMWDKLQPRHAVQSWAWWTATAITLVCACFLAWREQFQRVRPPAWPAIVVEPLPNVDVITTAAGVRVSAYLSVANVSPDTLTADLTDVSVGSGVVGLSAHHVTLKPHAVQRVEVRGSSTTAGGIALRKTAETEINGYLTIQGFERRGFTVRRVPVRDGGVLAEG
jgi:hypothetical protein